MRELWEKLREFDAEKATFEKEREASYEKAREQYGFDIRGNKYSQSAHFKNMIEDIENRYSSKMQENQDIMQKYAGERLAKVKTVIEDFVSTPIPEDLKSTLEMIKSGVDLSENEIQIIWEKYGNLYLSRRVIADAFGSKLHLDSEYLERFELDTILGDIKELEETLAQIIKDPSSIDRGASYIYRVTLGDTAPNPLMTFSERLKNFLGDDFNANGLVEFTEKEAKAPGEQ